MVVSFFISIALSAPRFLSQPLSLSLSLSLSRQTRQLVWLTPAVFQPRSSWPFSAVWHARNAAPCPRRMCCMCAFMLYYAWVCFLRPWLPSVACLALCCVFRASRAVPAPYPPSTRFLLLYVSCLFVSDSTLLPGPPTCLPCLVRLYGGSAASCPVVFALYPDIVLSSLSRSTSLPALLTHVFTLVVLGWRGFAVGVVLSSIVWSSEFAAKIAELEDQVRSLQAELLQLDKQISSDAAAANAPALSKSSSSYT